ncbi:hypothetical protein [Citreicoccus inhibens]|uniref:hypothetical protein n=1 Tax=Citreicoccus inhibens TaxID=2849499 RepID=UPI001EF09457|nr:hypothetical protein [Citreicoccus inhibens]
MSAPESRPARAKPVRDEGRHLRDSLLDYLTKNELLDGVRWMSEPGQLPLVTMHCTPQAQERLRKAGQFTVGTGMPLDLHG